MTAADHFCVFEVSGDVFAASAKQIREIIPTPNFTLVPCASSALAGVWHEGSEFIPILRLPFLEDEEAGKETQVLIIHGQFVRWGLLVDQVHNIAAIECSGGNEDTANEWSKALMGMSSWQGAPVRILNLDALYQLSEEMLEQKWATQIDSQDSDRLDNRKVFA